MNEIHYLLIHSLNERNSSIFENIIFECLENIEVLLNNYYLILEHYDTKQESDIKTTTDRYEAELPEFEKKYQAKLDELEEDEEELKISYAGYYSGLDNFNKKYHWGIAATRVKYKHYYDLSSKSTLISLYSNLEKTLKSISQELGEEFSKRVTLEHLNNKNYIKSSLDYLDLVLDMDMDKIDPLASKIESYQLVRNKIIHSLSEFNDLEKIRPIVQSNKGFLQLEPNKSTSTLRIFDAKYVELFTSLTKEILYEIVISTGKLNEFKLIRRGLLHCFKILDEKIILENISFSKLTNTQSEIVFDFTSKKKSISNGACKIILKESKKNTLEIINQIENKKVKKFTQFISNYQIMFFRYIFKHLIIRKAGLKIRVLIY